MDILDLEDQLDEKTKLLISKMKEQIESKDKEIDNLKKELAFLKGQLLNKSRKILGQSADKVNIIPAKMPNTSYIKVWLQMNY